MLALMAALVMVLSLLAGCGGKDGNDGKDDSKGDAPSTSEPSTGPSTTPVNTDWEGAETAAGLSGKVTYMHSGDDYEREMYANVFKKYMEYAPGVEVEQMFVIPVSATVGDNVTKSSERMLWYQGKALLDYLETVDIKGDGDEDFFYLPVQRVCRPDRTFRGFQGEIAGGEITVGQEIETLPSREKARVKSLYVLDKKVERAGKGQPVTTASFQKIS